MLSEKNIYSALEEVMDPEIPTISVVDLGIVADVKIADGNIVSVVLIPTFAGCPALRVMEELVYEKIKKMEGVNDVVVKTNFDVAWNTNRITEKGKLMLLKHGLAPPEKHDGYLELDVLSDVACPHCGSRNTELRSPFGPTLCRAMHYCKNCLNMFEQFKPIV